MQGLEGLDDGSDESIKDLEKSGSSNAASDEESNQSLNLARELRSMKTINSKGGKSSALKPAERKKTRMTAGGFNKP